MASVARVTEITATSNKSFEDAIHAGISKASETVRNIQGAWVKDQKVLIDNGAIDGYQVDMKVTFVVDS
ncbi:MAG: dodecin family protein [Gammaproteobacteria bacterium]